MIFFLLPISSQCPQSRSKKDRPLIQIQSALHPPTTMSSRSYIIQYRPRDKDGNS
ncbi:hypothetical protein Pyn_38066 [Prunus yedoensis var. nudiflora]|uniref:Uncharacterized protein n=1 Tax=Prunus yedoensis var. nudiflora TaxID=2094558 RepID=A0A314ZH85_PRUYE|nr:hypothetical protein Pyn_38066 [Prunus yedoensis var. nudiflora]